MATAHVRAARRLRGPTAGDRGTATAELAVALSALAVVVGLLLWMVAAVSAQMRCVDAARAGARSLARGDSVATAVAMVRTLAPAETGVQVSRAGEWIRIELSAPLDELPGVRVFGSGSRITCAAALPVEEGPWPRV